MPATSLIDLIDDYKRNPDLTYQSWFLHNEDRLKAFRSIRRGVLQVISDIKEGSFPNDFKGSSLEFVLSLPSPSRSRFLREHPTHFTGSQSFVSQIFMRIRIISGISVSF